MAGIPFRTKFGVDANDRRVRHVADAPFDCLLDAVNQQVALRLRGLNVVARRGNLPVPALDRPIPDGAQYLVHLDFNGHELNRVYTWREITGQLSINTDPHQVEWNPAPVNGVVQTGEWISSTLKDWVAALRADPRPTTDLESGDLWAVTEHDHEQLFTFDGVAWQNLYDADRVKAWIAALNLFEGTVNEDGKIIPGAVQFNQLPDLTLNRVQDGELAAHYFTFVGSPGYVIKAADPHGIGADLAGAILNPGDWIQVYNKGTPEVPDLHWTFIGGDLLAKSRGDNLYGLKPWADGSWEQGSLVIHNGDLYRALVGVVAGNLAPDVAALAPATNPWELVPISGGLKVAQVDPGGGTGALPDSAPAGQVWIVLQSAKAGNQQALYGYDAAAKEWQELGGGGVPMDLTGGEELINVGLPIGTIVAYFNIKPPPGWLLCNGQVCPAIYKEIQPYLWDGKVPDLRGQFIMGSESDANDQINGFTKHQDTTRLPRNPFTAAEAGDHQHIGGQATIYNWAIYGAQGQGYGFSASESGDRYFPKTSTAGKHTHNITGGDPVTRPPHVIMAYIIKVADRAIRPRVTTP